MSERWRLYAIQPARVIFTATKSYNINISHIYYFNKNISDDITLACQTFPTLVVGLCYLEQKTFEKKRRRNHKSYAFFLEKEKGKHLNERPEAYFYGGSLYMFKL